MGEDSSQTQDWLDQFRGGDMQALGALFDFYRSRLRQMVQFRLDKRLAARIDPSDVLQEVYLDAARQVAGYLHQPKVAFYVWLRGLAWERVLMLQRRDVGAKRRSTQREQQLPLESSALLAQQLLAQEPTPSQALVKKELRRRVQRALARLAPEDQEVILMREFENLSNREVAQVLGLGDAGATMRYGRALYRLKEILLADLSPGETTP
jgi:RNA polymerase sigma-70 factor (ECF subfamily)